ncbi:hypothetical protein PUN28_010851 [Cardiocondyla obscurior]|uniref:Uncharacterized protein n=1 Tax=Cardiocondyla obscurior TaxID=286306 RepID=A0AAW2FKK9_9HYME
MYVGKRKYFTFTSYDSQKSCEYVVTLEPIGREQTTRAGQTTVSHVSVPRISRMPWFLPSSSFFFFFTPFRINKASKSVFFAERRPPRLVHGTDVDIMPRRYIHIYDIYIYIHTRIMSRKLTAETYTYMIES